MNSTIRFWGDSERRNLRFARQLPRDGIPFADTADKIIGWGSAAGLFVLVLATIVGVA